MKFDYFSKLFLQIIKNECKLSTYYKYKTIVDKRLDFLKSRDIKTIRASEIRLWFSSLELSSKTLSDYKSVLNQIFLLAKYDDCIDKNPIEYIPNLKKIKPQIYPFNSSEVKEILKASKFYPVKFQIFLLIGFYSGMRTGEILALKKENIDLIKRVINIKKARSKFGEHTPKTLSSIRSIPINNFIYDDLKNYIETLQTDYLIVNQYSKPYKDLSSFIRYYWKPLLKGLNLAYRKPYIMRHTYATNILKKGNLSPYELSKLLGHTTTEMVYNRYVKFIENRSEVIKINSDIY